MADQADIAYETEQFSFEICLAARQRHRLPVTGVCHNCQASVVATLFCDGDCREDYEKRLYFLRMKGG